MSQLIPGVIATTIAPPSIWIQDRPRVQGADAVVDSATADAGSVPTTRIRPGQALVLETATGRYVAANAATGDRNAAAALTAVRTAGADENAAVLTFSVSGGPAFTVTLGGATATDAAVAADLNANARFAGELIADVVAARVRVRTLHAGAHVTLQISDDGAVALFGTAAAPVRAGGTDADYRVSTDFVDLVNENNVATHQPVANALVGFFDESEIRNLTAEARAVLSRRGSLFG